jgi:hypothetical protein
MQAALHVASRLTDPQAVERVASVAAAQSDFPAFNQWCPPSIAQGNAGLALLWAYLDECFPGGGWDVVGRTHLEVAARSAEQSPGFGTGLFSGLTGLAFAGWQLSRGGQRYRRLLASLDEAIAAETLACADRVAGADGLSVGEFDVISGLSGIGAYLMCRRRHPPMADALARTIAALTALTTREGVPPAWHTPPQMLYDDQAREMYPHGNLNCGLAHGIPGVLALLSLARTSGCAASASVDDAIVAIAGWLAACRVEDEWGVNWPTAVSLEATARGTLQPGDAGRAPGGTSRSAWCYGSPGIARALWLAGQAVDRQEFRELAIEAMAAVFRRPIAERRIDSPTFCHGVAGLLAIATRFARETGAPLFVEESERLVQQILDAFQPDSRLGFRNIEYRNNQTDQPGLLDGAAGVAIVLLAAATGVEPTWDRAFLLA